MIAIFRRGQRWEFIGIYCEHHMKDVIRNYGMLRIQTLDTESVPLDTGCHIHGCRDRPSFTAEKVG